MTFHCKWHQVPGQFPHESDDYLITYSHQSSQNANEIRKRTIAQYDRILEEFHFHLPDGHSYIGLASGRVLVHISRGHYDLHPRFRLRAWASIPPSFIDS